MARVMAKACDDLVDCSNTNHGDVEFARNKTDDR